MPYKVYKMKLNFSHREMQTKVGIRYYLLLVRYFTWAKITALWQGLVLYGAKRCV